MGTGNILQFPHRYFPCGGWGCLVPPLAYGTTLFKCTGLSLQANAGGLGNDPGELFYFLLIYIKPASGPIWPYIFLILHYTYGLYFQQFHQIDRLNPKDTTQIPWLL